jgi:L-Lysine epsilon oxidase N-terminal/L-lysine epsilon oxidase C-terminal domain
MPATFRIHPAIGIARVGNSPDAFYLAPDRTGGLPIDCDANGLPVVTDGVEQPVSSFKDDQGRIKRQAARFRVFVYDADGEGREVKVGDVLTVQKTTTPPRRATPGSAVMTLKVRVTGVRWTVYLANKKASWYEFLATAGEHGYAPNHPLRNARYTAPGDRQALIIDPGPRSVRYSDAFGDGSQRRARFDAASSPGPATFPPPLQPNSIATLGELIATEYDGLNRLLVLGGFGNSGSMNTGFATPQITSFANNDGWFDDVSDGPVNAEILYELLEMSGVAVPPGQSGSIEVNDPAWVIVGYPRYAPEIIDIVTLDDLLYDLSVRTFAYEPYLYGVAPFDRKSPPLPPDGLAEWSALATWNPDYHPYWERDIRPILMRPYFYQFVMDFDPTLGGYPHEIGPGGNFDLELLSVPPYEGEDPIDRARRRDARAFLYWVLRRPGEENVAQAPPYPGKPNMLLFKMPRLCGDNPLADLDDTAPPAKFLRLTDTMLFILKQWAEGKFINEKREDITAPPFPGGEGGALDRGALGSGLGGSFCPGGETSWIMRNPALYSAPYRIRHAAAYQQGALSQPAVVTGAATSASLQNGLEPGDVSKYDAVPWQADFNECSTQDIDVTYTDWNAIYPESTGDPVKQIVQLVYWWPAHRPMMVNGAAWSPTSQTLAGDLQMVTAWASLGFVTRNPMFLPGYQGAVDPAQPVFILSET